MIADTYENREKYSKIHPDWDRAFKIIEELVSKPIPEGENVKDVIEGLPVCIQTYVSKNEEEKKFEAHQRCVDIQFMVDGKEIIYWSKTDGLEVCVPYSEVRDHMSLAAPEDGGACPIYLKKGYFAVFFPGDAHKTQCKWGENEKVVKIIMKLPL